MASLIFTGRLSLAALLFLAGLSKLTMRQEFRQSLERMVVIPSAWVSLMATGLPLVELTTAVGLIGADTSFVAAAAALVLFSAFAIVTSLQLWLAEDRSSCNCYWNADRLSWKMPVRNVACAFIAAAIAWPQHVIAFGSLAAVLLLATLRSMNAPAQTRASKAIAS